VAADHERPSITSPTGGEGARLANEADLAAE
jgi:hypothetical protein